MSLSKLWSSFSFHIIFKSSLKTYNCDWFFLLLALKSYCECYGSSFESSWCGNTETRVVYSRRGYQDDRGRSDFSKTPKLSPFISSPHCLPASEELNAIHFQQNLGDLLDRSLLWRIPSLPEDGYDLPHLPKLLPGSLPCTAATPCHHLGYCVSRALPYYQEYSLALDPLKTTSSQKLFRCLVKAAKVSSKSFLEMHKI